MQPAAKNLLLDHPAVAEEGPGLKVQTEKAQELSEMVVLQAEISRLSSVVQLLSSQAPVTSFRMPFRGEPSAPVFSGADAEVRRFLSDVDMLGSEAGLGEAQKIQWALRYASESESEVWGLLPESVEGDWASFGLAVIGLYPGAAENYGKRFRDLEELVSVRQQAVFASEEEYGQFHRQFLRISVPLAQSERLSVQESSRFYLRALPDHLKPAVLARLSTRFPDQHPDDPFSVADLYQASLWCLPGLLHSNPHSQLSSKHRSNPIPLSTTPSALLQPHPSSHPAPLPPQPLSPSPTLLYESSPVSPSTIRPSGCLFCGSLGHKIRHCHRSKQYLAEGKTIYGQDGHVRISDGNFIPRVKGLQYLGERVDAYWSGREDLVVRRNKVTCEKVKMFTFPAFSSFQA